MSASSLIAGGPRPANHLAQLMTQVPPEVQVQLQRAGQRIMQLEGEMTALQTRYLHYFAVLACVIKHHNEGKPMRFPFDLMNKIETGCAIDTSKDPVSEEMIVTLLSAKEAQFRVANLEEISIDMTIPNKPPFILRPELPARATLQGIMQVSYVGGRQNGKVLDFAGENMKPKKPRSFAVKVIKEEGRPDQPELRFTTDSAGMIVRIGLVVRKPASVEPEAEPEAQSALKFVNEECREWHSSPNDGLKIVGRFCPHCGDSRKIENEQAS
jgi:hypothetical protein